MHSAQNFGVNKFMIIFVFDRGQLLTFCLHFKEVQRTADQNCDRVAKENRGVGKRTSAGVRLRTGRPAIVYVFTPETPG